MAGPSVMEARQSEEASLCARAAWLYFSGGLTQGEIARRLGVPSSKAHRLVARAMREGLVRVFVDASVAECVALEETLTGRYGLTHCRVAPDLDEGPLPLRTLGIVGAGYLRNLIETDRSAVIGVGHGRTLAAMVSELPSLKAEGVRFVSLLGGLTRKFAANPFDVIHRLAEKTGAEAYMLPVPIFANTAADRDVLMAQLGVAQVFAMVQEAGRLLVGIGEEGAGAYLEPMMLPAERDALKRAGARGELLGHFFDAKGRPVRTGLEDRTLSPPLAALTGRPLIAIAGGLTKTAAISAVLESGLLKGLMTDEATARRLVEGSPRG